MTDKRLEELLNKVREDKTFIEFIFDYCETQEERVKMIDFIETNNPTYQDILIFASVIAIEAGTAEGELEEV